jgi:hypothetical protein
MHCFFYNSAWANRRLSSLLATVPSHQRRTSRLATALSVGLMLTQMVSSTTALGQDAGGTSGFAAGVTAGTLGIGGEASYLVNPYIVARSNITWLSFNYGSILSKMTDINSDNYDFTLNEFTVGGLLDFHMFRNGFRGVVGLRYADFNFSQSRADRPSYAINGHIYSNAEIGALNTVVTVRNRAAPYIGLGWDSAHHFSSVRDAADWTGERFTVSFDLGALYTGGVNVNMTTDRTVPSLPNDLLGESHRLKNSFNNIYSFYPVAMTTFKYRF